MFIKINYKTHFFIFIPGIEDYVTMVWYRSWWCIWVFLTFYLYYHDQTRDLGPSHDIYDYNPEDNMGIYKTLGPVLIFCWSLWTFVADAAFLAWIDYLLHKLFILRAIKWYWYTLTIYSSIKMAFINFINFIISSYNNNVFIYNNFWLLSELNYVFISKEIELFNVNFITYLKNLNDKTTFFWFPWTSIFTYLTIFGLIYILILFSIYSTENVYYIVLYTIFLILIFSVNLITLDLDIFAGLLLLIESVVILMLFFLIIYLTPNINVNHKLQKWQVWLITVIIISITSIISYVNLSNENFFYFSLSSIFLDDIYEALNDLNTNELVGIYITLYWTNSILLIIVGLLLLIASIICVVLVSFFTKNRNYNIDVFLDLYNIAKTCYSFIFLRKQNLSKQGRNITSTRIFKKKDMDTKLYTEYKLKQEMFDKKKNKI